ncbi:OsmC family protein [Desulfosarcina cetonica]|nr:OsmC family protein [Desulfosarcina cetonica]
MMEMDITFAGGKKVNAQYKGFTHHTDQSASEGGGGSAPEPFDLFLASMGTCAGAYVVYFCESRNISTDGIRMTMRMLQNEKTHLMETIDIDLFLPPEFPEKYRKAVVRAAGMCTVKRTLVNPPVVKIHAR